MTKLKRILVWAGLGIFLILFCTASASVGAVPSPEPTTNTVTNPNLVEQLFAPGGFIIVGLGGVLLIIKEVNAGRSIRVAYYKDLATTAENERDTEIGKVHTKLTAMEGKIDQLIADKDQLRTQFETKKTEWTARYLELQRVHHAETEDVYGVLAVELRYRHELEELLSDNGIDLPPSPPPYTRKMMDSVTGKDMREAKEAVRDSDTATLPPVPLDEVPDEVLDSDKPGHTD